MEVGIQKLSPAQLKKLESGQPVRAKLGSAMSVHISMADAKKLMAASKKGSAATITGAGLVKKSHEFNEAARPYAVNKTVSPIKQAATASAVSGIKKKKGKGMVKKSNEFAEAARPYTVNKTVSPIKQAATTSAVSRIKKKKGRGTESIPSTAPMTSPVETTEPPKVQFGAGMCGCEGSCGCGIVKSSVDRGMKEYKHGKKVGNRAVSGMGQQMNNAPGLGWTNKRGQTMAVDAYGNKRRTEPDPDRPGHVRYVQEPMDGGKVNRRKKFDQWFKSIGSKFKTLNHNLQPIKRAATDRAVDYIKYYNNPQAQAQAAIDLAQEEARDTRQLMRPGRKGKQSESQAASQLVVLPRVAAPEFADPIAVDVNDDGEPDGFFTPNEMQFFGAGKKRGPSSSPWIAHVKAYAKEHGMKYGDALKAAKATYTRGAGSKAKYGENNKGHKLNRYRENHNWLGQRTKFQPKDEKVVYRLDSGQKVSREEYYAAEDEKRRQYIQESNQREREEKQEKKERRQANQAAKAAAAAPVTQPAAQPAASPVAPSATPPVVGAGKRGPSSSPWIAHVKAYARQHGMKYGDALKEAKATYKRGGALYPAGYTP